MPSEFHKIIWYEHVNNDPEVLLDIYGGKPWRWAEPHWLLTELMANLILDEPLRGAQEHFVKFGA